MPTIHGPDGPLPAVAEQVEGEWRARLEPLPERLAHLVGTVGETREQALDRLAEAVWRWWVGPPAAPRPLAWEHHDDVDGAP